MWTVESGYIRLVDMNTLLVNGIREEAFWRHRKAKYIGVRDVDTWYLMVSNSSADATNTKSMST